MSLNPARLADWLGLNRATVGVLVAIGCLGLSEELWANFLGLHIKAQVSNDSGAKAFATAALYVGIVSSAKNLLEGFGYIIGGSVAHRLGPRIALAISAIPMAIGFLIMLASANPWAIVAGAMLMSNWEPLSVPATFEVVGSELPKNRRTIAFAMQSIQKRLPKVIGPAVGGLMLGAVGYWLNLASAFALLGISVVVQMTLMRRMRPTADPARVPIREVLARMPPDLRALLRAEIFIRWGDWFARDFAVLYVVSILTARWGWTEASATQAAGWLLAIMAMTALVTYIPVAKWADRSASPRPFIGTTFFLFAIFPIALVLLPRAAASLGMPVIAALVVAYVLNGLREIGEPARKALITTGFDPAIRARGVGVYWGMRSFAFFPAPIVAALLWSTIGPDATFLIGGAIGLIGTAVYVSNSQIAR